MDPGHRVALGRLRGPERTRLLRVPGRDEQPDRGPDHATRDDPDGQTRREGHDDRDPRAHDRRDELAPAGDQPDRQADHRGREDDVDPEARRVRDPATQERPGERRQVPRDERRPDRGDPVAALVGPADALEVGHRERVRLVGEEVRHEGASGDRDAPQPRRERGRVQQVPGVEQRGQEQDPGPGEARRDVADRGELGGPREHDDAHRHRLDEGEAGFAGGQPVDEPEADGRDRDADRVGCQPAPAGGEVRVERRAQRRKVFAQVPSHTT